MTSWYILKTESAKETKVELSLSVMGLLTYLPLEYRTVTVSRRARKTALISKPAIPRIVFFFASQSFFPMPDIRYSAGLARSSGAVWSVTDTQMRYFQEGMAAAYYGDGAWLPITKEEKKAHKAREKHDRTANSLADLVKFTPRLFGINPDELENAA